MMQQNLAALFTPINSKGLEIKNRIVMAPMQLGLGFRNQKARAFIKEGKYTINWTRLSATALWPTRCSSSSSS